MLRPIPLPSFLLFKDLSACTNLSKIDACISLGIPIPLSFMLILTQSFDMFKSTNISPWFWVNFIAFESKLRINLSIFTGSHFIMFSSTLVSKIILISLFSEWGITKDTIFSTRNTISLLVKSAFKNPTSILLTSIRLFISLSIL